jgi:IK cytokine
MKMPEGWKSRHFEEANKKAKLNCQWKKISNIMERKREAGKVEVRRQKY